MEKARKISVLLVFGLLVFGFAPAQLFTKDADSSASERRKLTGFPSVTADSVFSGEFSGDFEKYLLDQFPARDAFRSAKAVTALDVLRLSDNRGYYINNGVVFSHEYPLKENQVLLAADKIESISDAHPESGSVYYAIIPDKNYFSPLRDSHPSIDYDRLVSLMGESISSAEYIDIFDALSLEDYYATDTHWRQERLENVLFKLCGEMGLPGFDITHYEKNSAGIFSGVLAGQSALAQGGEEMYYMVSPATKNAVVSSAELGGGLPVYSLEKFTGMEPYDIFLYGAQAVITIENAGAQTDRELIIFRDSFGSSLTPLLIDSYSKITVFDLRYMTSSLIDDYADFTGADVLFIYSTMLINSGGILR